MNCWPSFKVSVTEYREIREPPPERVPWSLIALALFFAGAGGLHFVLPRAYARIVPPWLPNAPLLVAVSGAAEVIGGIGLLLPLTRRAAAWALIALLIAVLPANVQMLRLDQAAGASVLWQIALWVRLPLQGVLIWWVWQVAWRRRAASEIRPR